MIEVLPIISATVRPLENLPLGNPLPKSIPYQGKLAWARLLLKYLLFPTSERESPNINCTILQLWPSIRMPKMVTTNIATPTLSFMVLIIKQICCLGFSQSRGKINLRWIWAHVEGFINMSRECFWIWEKHRGWFSLFDKPTQLPLFLVTSYTQIYDGMSLKVQYVN